nr:HEPN domain-containing protein [Pedobacter sp. SYSU D00535]
MGVQPYLLNYIPYSFNRLNRALLFLDMARGNQFLPIKITFYIGLLESILSNSSEYLISQLVARIPFFLTKSRFTVGEMARIIKDAYKVRSNFIHGDNVKTTLGNRKRAIDRNELIDISKKIDNLARELLIDALNTHKKELTSDNAISKVWIDRLYPMQRIKEEARGHLFTHRRYRIKKSNPSDQR